MKLKIAMLAIAGLAFMQSDANAQSSKYDINYPICKADGKYTVCAPGEAMYKQELSSGKEAAAPAPKKVTKPVCEVTEVVFVSSSYKNNPRLRASFDRPGDVYEGKEVLSNDGVEKNIERNINYLDFSVNRPPNDGGLSTRK